MGLIGAHSRASVVFRKPALKETAVLLFVAWLLPLLIHLVPFAAPRPLGAYLLPMFWPTFVAAYFFGARTAVLVGLFGPALNLLLTGLPAVRWLGLLSAELVIFAIVATWMVRRAPQFLFVAPVAGTVAKLSGAALLAASDRGKTWDPGAAWRATLEEGLAGLLLLAIINVVLVRFWPKQRAAAHDAPLV